MREHLFRTDLTQFFPLWDFLAFGIRIPQEVAAAQGRSACLATSLNRARRQSGAPALPRQRPAAAPLEECGC